MDYKNSMEATVRYHLNSQQFNAEKPPAPAGGCVVSIIVFRNVETSFLHHPTHLTISLYNSSCLGPENSS